MNPLQEKAMLVQLTIKQWTATKQDKGVTGEVERKHGAHDAGQFAKRLVSKDLLDPIAKIAGQARENHYHYTLAWNDSGQRLLPSDLFAEYTAIHRQLHTKFDAAVDTMVLEYPREVQAARNRLGTMYNPGDYPDPSDMKGRFALKLDFSPVPDASDFRVSVGKDDRERLAESVRSAISDRQAAAVSATYSRIRDVVSKMSERLGDPAAIFKDSLVHNTIQLVSILDGLNITNDPVITDLCQDIKLHLTQPPTALRTSKHLREITAAHADRILRKLP